MSFDSFATDRQLTALASRLKSAGLTKRDDRLDFIATLIGRPIDSSAELTQAEARALLDKTEGRSRRYDHHRRGREPGRMGRRS